MDTKDISEMFCEKSHLNIVLTNTPIFAVEVCVSLSKPKDVVHDMWSDPHIPILAMLCKAVSDGEASQYAYLFEIRKTLDKFESMNEDDIKDYLKGCTHYFP